MKKGIDDKRPEYYVSLGQCYYFLQNYTEAIPWLKKAADKGITDSYFTLGLSFYFLKNYTEAIIWFEKAAKLSSIEMPEDLKVYLKLDTEQFLNIL